MPADDSTPRLFVAPFVLLPPAPLQVMVLSRRSTALLVMKTPWLV